MIRNERQYKITKAQIKKFKEALEKFEKQKSNGLSRKLVGFEMLERGIPRQHYPILDTEGNSIGEVTSGTMSPMLNRGIGMGYVNVQHAAKKSDILIGIRNKQIPAVIVKPPFYKSPV